MNEENLNNENTQPMMDQAPVMPEAPAAPEMPAEPVMPEAPVMPEVPAAPEMPAEPVMPEAPMAPEAPAMPEAPAPEMPAPETPMEQPAPEAAAPAAAPVEDKGSFGWAVLGFFFPLIGLILFLVWKNTRHGDAKKAGIGALVAVILQVVLCVLYFFVFAAMIGGFMAGVADGLENSSIQWEIEDTNDDNTYNTGEIDYSTDDYSVVVDESGEAVEEPIVDEEIDSIE